MKNPIRWIAPVIALAIIGLAIMEAAPPVHAQIPSANQAPPWTCSLDNIAATLTRCAVANVDGTSAMYLVTVVAQSTTSTAGQFLLQYGTGTNCGTGTTSILPSSASAVRIAAPANTAAATVITLSPALKIPAGKDLCVLGVATNTFTGQLSGYYGAQ